MVRLVADVAGPLNISWMRPYRHLLEEPSKVLFPLDAFIALYLNRRDWLLLFSLSYACWRLIHGRNPIVATYSKHQSFVLREYIVAPRQRVVKVLS